jgi:hypothetical protein
MADVGRRQKLYRGLESLDRKTHRSHEIRHRRAKVLIIVDDRN